MYFSFDRFDPARPARKDLLIYFLYSSPLLSCMRLGRSQRCKNKFFGHALSIVQSSTFMRLYTFADGPRFYPYKSHEAAMYYGRRFARKGEHPAARQTISKTNLSARSSAHPIVIYGALPKLDKCDALRQRVGCRSSRSCFGKIPDGPIQSLWAIIENRNSSPSAPLTKY